VNEFVSVSNSERLVTCMSITKVYVQYNDIYYLREPINGELLQVTYDGYLDIDRIYNGVPDWVYEGKSIT